MSSRTQSSKQGRELRNSRGRLPSSKPGDYELFQARTDIRAKRINIGSTPSGPTYRERVIVIDENHSSVSDAPVAAPVVSTEPSSEILKLNEELKYQADQHKAEIEQLKGLIEQIRKAPSVSDSQLKPEKQVDDTSKQALLQQEMGYTLQEIVHKLRMLETGVHHIEKDSGDPVVIHRDGNQNQNNDVDIENILNPIRKNIEHIEENIINKDDVVDIINKIIQPIKTDSNLIKDALTLRMDKIQEIVDTIVKTKSSTTPDSLKKEEVSRMLIPLIEDIRKNAKDVQTASAIIDSKLANYSTNKSVSNIESRVHTLEQNLKIKQSTVAEADIRSIETRIHNLSESIKTLSTPTVSKADIQSVQDSVKVLREELKTELQTNRQSSRNESAEREREILKEQQRISEKLSELEKKISGKDILKRTGSTTQELYSIKEEKSISPPTEITNTVVYMTDDDTKKRLVEIEEKLEAIQKKPPPAARSVTPIQRRSQSREREIDGHRLRDVPIFSAELRETMVVKGDAGPMPLINDSLWNIIADTAAGFDYGGGYYECPVTGSYSINLICKTLSTSVTLKITLIHIDSTGHIMKAYSLDQSNMINEHSMNLRLPHAEKGDRLKFVVESRFNIAIKGHEEIEVRGQKYPIVSTLVQIAYIPPVGFCET